ncbi:MAG: choice-of-anchor D domain-containing protein [Elainellaceae cyanobacterium]
MVQIRRAMRDDAHADMEQRLNAACAGDTEAIAALIERSLMLSRVAVRARIEGRCLYLILYGQAGQQDSLVRFIKSGLQQIRIEGVNEIDIAVYPDEFGQGEPIWSYHGQLRSSRVSTLAAPKAAPPGTSPRRVKTGSHNTQWTASGIRIDAASPGPQRWVPQSAAPPAEQPLFDRQSAVHKAVKAIKSGAPLQVYGPSGAGKTTFLRNLIHQQEVQQFGDGMVYIETYKALSIDLLQHLFEALYRSDNPVQTKPTMPEIRHALRSRNSLAVIDQIEALDSLDSLIDTVPLLLAARTCHLWERGEVIPLESFSDHEALTFLELQLGRALSVDEQRSAMDLCRHLKGNPALLIQHVGLVRRGQSFAELAQQIDAGFSPDTLVMRAASDLSDEERRLLATLAVFGPVPIQTHHLQAIAGVDSASLTKLRERGLVWGSESYRLASNLLAPLQQVWDLTPWYERAVHYFGSWATSQHERIPTSGEAATPDTLAMLELLWRLLELSMDRQQWSDSLSLCHALDPLLYQYCRWGRWQQVWELGQQAAQEMGDRAAESWALHQMGSVALCLNDSFAARAYLAEAQQIRQQEGDMVGAALSQHNLIALQQEGKEVARNEAARPAAAAPAAAFVSMSHQLPLKWLLLGGAVTMAGIGALVGLQGEASDISVRPRLVSFPPQQLSTTSETREIVVRNTSSEALSIDEIIFTRSDDGAADSGASEGDAASDDLSPEDRASDERASSPIINGEEALAALEDNFQMQESCTNNTLAPDATCTIEAQFTPQLAGPHATTVSIIDDQQTLETVILRGVGAEADAEFRPRSLEFEPLRPDTEPMVETVTLRNTGPVAFTVSAVDIEDTEAFTVKTDECAGQTLDTRDTCRIGVQFDPPKSGEFAATLTVNSPTRSSIWTLPLSASAPSTQPSSGQPGISSPSRSPRISLPPIRLPSLFTPSPQSRPTPRPQSKPEISASVESVTFSGQPTGSIRTQQVTLTNTGSGDLYFDAIGLKETDDFAIAGTTCGLLKPNEDCVVAVDFIPQAAGEHKTQLEISGNLEAPAIPISGVATQPLPQRPRSPEAGSPAADSPNELPQSERPDSPPAQPPQTRPSQASQARTPKIQQLSLSSGAVGPGEAVDLCYDVADAEALSLSDGQTTMTLQNLAECLPLSPQATTTYTLIARSGEKQVEQSVTITVENEAVSAPIAAAVPPVPLSPGTAGDAPPVTCIANPLVLQWEGSAASYEVTLQREETVDDRPVWMPILSQTVSQTQLNVSGSVSSFGLHRWQVRSLSDSGTAGPASAWQYFTCVVE